MAIYNGVNCIVKVNLFAENGDCKKQNLQIRFQVEGSCSMNLQLPRRISPADLGPL